MADTNFFLQRVFLDIENSESSFFFLARYYFMGSLYQQ